jgi:hypothetical protein
MIDISTNPQVLDSLDNPEIVIYEYIRGFRISVIVNEGKIVLDQDRRFNSQEFDKIFSDDELDSIWEGALNTYRVDLSRLRMAPMGSYVLRCIYYDARYLQDSPQEYPERGLVIVEVVQPSGIPINSNGFKEFSEVIGLPANKPLFKGSIESFKDSLPILKIKSWLSKNMIPAGFVIYNEPHSFLNESTVNRWRMMLDVEIEALKERDLVGKAEDMALELIGRFITQETIEDFEEKTQLDAIRNRNDYIKTFLNYIKKNFASEYERYYRASVVDLKSRFDGRGIALRFSAMAKSAVEHYIDKVILQTHKYSHRR